MTKKCQNCRLVNYAGVDRCARCDSELGGGATVLSGKPRRPSIALRAAICVGVCVVLLAAFYLSLIATSRSLDREQKQLVKDATSLIREKGFDREAMFLESFSVYRSSDNWLNSLVAKESAYAATNFPFQIITIYPDFVTYPVDNVERAAILLHEARHLQGGDEKDAYQFVWRNRAKLGWTKEKYAQSSTWRNVRRQTREYAPEIFGCRGKDFEDCTEF
jgi:hypothetical protein